MTWADVVDRCLDDLHTADPTITDFDRNDIARVMPCSARRATTSLAAHVRAQGRGPRRWTISARSYGLGTRWYILDGPGGLGATLRARRALTIGHAQHIANDAANRVRTDLLRELNPAIVGHPLVQAVVVGMAKQIEMATLSAVQTIEAMNAVWESQSGEVADLRGVASV